MQNIWFGGCIDYFEIEQPLEQGQEQEVEQDEEQTVSTIINKFVDYLQAQTQEEQEQGQERTGTSATINGLIDRLQNQTEEQQEETINETINGLMLHCAGNTGVYRVCACTLLFFLFAALVVRFKPTANREAWPAKYVLFVFLCALSIFVPNAPYFLPIYVIIARIGAGIFILMEQVILIDIAYNWNESWVEKANQAEFEEGLPDAGQKWLSAILISCAFLFLGSLATIIFMFVEFNGCSANIAFISITLILIMIITVTQLTGEQGSLLSSAIMASWATYLCFSAVTKNPNEQCNPYLYRNDISGIVMGLIIALIGLGWTGFSYTAESTISGGGDDSNENDDVVSDEKVKNEQPKIVTGIVTNDDQLILKNEEDGRSLDEVPVDKLSIGWKINLILASVSCFVAMSLTGWGTIKSGDTAANPQIGNINMWIVIASQWLGMLLYIWTLVAPKLLPSRDFD